MQDGNTSQIVIWVADLAIAKKPLGSKTLYYVADAVNGKAVPNATLDLFGYRQEWIPEKDDNRRGGYYQFSTKSFTLKTDKDGLAIPDNKDYERYSWVVTATAGERDAYLGFTGVWSRTGEEPQYERTRAFFITDRPIYRPAQAVKFKAWLTVARYEHEGKSPYAGQQIAVQINNPRGEKVYEGNLTADDYGGFDGEITLDKGRRAGRLSNLPAGRGYGSSTFRVEEYKKPEFEVTIEAPKEPVMLGEKITATVKANYYFGAPVTEAKVKYKVLRSSYTDQWYPIGAWDWYYGPGYWWFACDYPWYPAGATGGCRRPIPFWWHGPRSQPEVVAEGETQIGADGTLKIQIDTALAKELYGDSDHRYEITAEVTGRVPPDDRRPGRGARRAQAVSRCIPGPTAAITAPATPCTPTSARRRRIRSR